MWDLESEDLGDITQLLQMQDSSPRKGRRCLWPVTLQAMKWGILDWLWSTMQTLIVISPWQNVNGAMNSERYGFHPGCHVLSKDHFDLFYTWKLKVVTVLDCKAGEYRCLNASNEMNQVTQPQSFETQNHLPLHREPLSGPAAGSAPWLCSPPLSPRQAGWAPRGSTAQ